MAAPKENQFWKIRSKHGRDKLFATPELMLEAAKEYFEWCDENPWVSKETTQSEKSTYFKEKPTTRPYTLSGLCIYLGCSESYFRTFKSKNTEGSEDFLTVIAIIEDIIKTQQYEGAIVGAFKENIIARMQGLKEQTENTNLNIDKTPLTDEELEDEY
jgi:hypothetical protein